jgi:adenylate cyclase
MAWPRAIGIWLAPVVLLALGVFMILSDGLGLESELSQRLFDAYQRHAGGPFAHTSVPVRVLELPAFDEDRLVQVTRTLSAQSVRLIVFADPPALGPSPQSLLARLPPNSDAARAALVALPEPGHEMAQAIAQTQAVLPAVLGVAGKAPQVKARFVYRGTADPFAFAPHYAAANGPPALLEGNAAGLAAANLTPDGDGVVRRIPIAFRLGDGLVPGLAAEALRLLGGGGDIIVASDERDPLTFLAGIGIGGLVTGKGQIPTGKDGRAWLRYAAEPTPLDFDAVGALPLKGAVVVVGLEGKVVPTPLGPASTASVIARSLENLLENSVLIRPAWTRLAEASFLALAGAMMIYLLRLGLGWSALLALIASALAGLVSWSLYLSHGLLVDWVTPVTFLMASLLCAILFWLYDLQLTYARLRAAFSNSLPRASLEKIARNPGLLKPEGERRTVTYLSCGLHTGPASLDKRPLDRLIGQALAHGGTLDRVGADGFAVFWNAPLDDADHARHACEAANAMASAAAELAGDGVEISIGIATGEVMAGGGDLLHGHAGYSIQGDAPLLADRLRSLAHRYGAPLLVADTTQRLASRHAALLEIDTIILGSNTATLYALMGNAGVSVSPKFRALNVFHVHLFQAIRKQNWRQARELIAQCRKLSGANQALYELHLARIAWYERNPPGVEWDGAFRPILE